MRPPVSSSRRFVGSSPHHLVSSIRRLVGSSHLSSSPAPLPTRHSSLVTPPSPLLPPSSAFTFVELLCALALTATVALLLAALLHSLVRLSAVQDATLSGPLAARTALLRIAAEAGSAYAPPDAPAASTNQPPFSLDRSDDPTQPRSSLSFLLPVPLENPALPGYFALHRVTYLDRPSPPPARTRDLLRLSSPLLGPDASLVATQLLFRAPFRLDLAATPPPSPGHPSDPTPFWPLPSPAGNRPPTGQAPSLPALPSSLTLTLTLPDAPPLTLTTPLHATFTLPPRPSPAP